MPVETVVETREPTPRTVRVPAPTTGPIVLALGITLAFAGMVTSGSVSVLGGFLALAGAVGWFRDVLPQEAHESVPVEEAAEVVVPVRRQVDHAVVSEELKRVWLPLEIHPISAGIWGGLSGSVAIAVLAIAYGLASQNSIWYPINLLAAGFFPASMSASTAQLDAFHLDVLLVAIPIHLITSLLVGLLYGAMLPMLPRRPILLGGIIAPLMWTGLIHGILGVVDPALNHRIQWVWFVISQMGFGIVAGIVVSRTEKIRTTQRMPFALMMETPGIMEEHHREDEPR
jgi:hypothetical protein